MRRSLFSARKDLLFASTAGASLIPLKKPAIANPGQSPELFADVIRCADIFIYHPFGGFFHALGFCHQRFAAF